MLSKQIQTHHIGLYILKIQCIIIISMEVILKNKIKIIAEIGANHNGDMILAKEMIWAAAENGADYAKFQSWLEKDIGPGPWDSNDRFFNFKNKRDFYKNAELTNRNHIELIDECKLAKIQFLTTCFNLERLSFLNTLKMNTMKIASCDVNSDSMVKKICDQYDYMIASTGMHGKEEVKKLVDVLENSGKKYSLLHCVSEYPTKIKNIKMSRFKFIKDSVGPNGKFGISDHSLGTFFPKLAVSLGAELIEKHFTIDKNIPGPDNAMSINPVELLEIRRFCEDYESIDFESNSDPTLNEKQLRKVIHNRFGDNS